MDSVTKSSIVGGLLLIGVVIIIVSLLVVSVSFLAKDIDNAVEDYKVQQQKDEQVAYDAWVKVTGNNKDLTFKEWKALKDMNSLPKE